MPSRRLHMLLIFPLVLTAMTHAVQSSEPAASVEPKATLASPYTEDGARHIVEANGFYGVGRLVLDNAGTWRGTAIQYGRIIRIEVDRKGKFTGVEKR